MVKEAEQRTGEEVDISPKGFARLAPVNTTKEGLLPVVE